MSNPGANLIAGVTSQQDNRFRRRQQELDEAWRDRQMDLQQSQLDFRKDMWDTEKGWKEYEFQKGVTSDKIKSEMAENLYRDFQEQDAWDQAKSMWEEEEYGRNTYLRDIFLGDKSFKERLKTYNDWTADNRRALWNMAYNPLRMDYEDVNPAPRYSDWTSDALEEAIAGGYLTREMLEELSETQRKSPNKSGTVHNLLNYFKGKGQ